MKIFQIFNDYKFGYQKDAKKLIIYQSNSIKASIDCEDSRIKVLFIDRNRVIYKIGEDETQQIVIFDLRKN